MHDTKKQGPSPVNGRGIEGLHVEDDFVSITHDEWRKRFRPVMEHGTERDFWGVDGVEKRGERDPLCLWTEVQVDGGLAILSGMHSCNRVAHYYTEVPAPADVDIEVWTEPSWTEDEVRRVGGLIRRWQQEFGVVEDEVGYEDVLDWCLEIDVDLENILTWGFDELIEKHFPGLENVGILDDCRRTGGDDDD